MKKYILLLVLVIFISGCSKNKITYDMYEEPIEVTIELNENRFKVFEKHTNKELIKDSNILFDEEDINTDEIGKHIYTLTYKFEDKEYKKDIEYEVYDDVAPIFIRSSSYIILQVTEDDTLCDRISYGDNYDANVECIIEGEYDFNQVGTYNLEYVLKDSSGNETRKGFTLYIVEQLDPSSGSSYKPTYIHMDDILKYKNDNTEIGIDISRWQGDIDFKKVKEAGIEFVIIRMGYQKDDKDNYEKDMKFDEYYKQAKEAGLKVSVYVYTNASSDEGAKKAAKWIIKNLNGDKLDLPIAFDWEDWGDFNSYNMSIHTLSHAYLAFEKELKDNGYDAMLYSSKYYLENVWLDYENSNIWLAQYYIEPTFEGDFMLWQMSDGGIIDGINDNNVDIDILYKK